MGRTPEELWWDDVDFADTEVLFIEWTHGNSDLLTEVDIPILLNSTPEETLAHRKARNRDGAVDSPFVMMVLRLEQDMLVKKEHKAKIIVSKSGELMSYEDFQKIMMQ
jgi:alpha-galactosidase